VQSDKLEKQFGNYREQCGARYHVSVSNILEAEKKLRAQKLVRNFGEIPPTLLASTFNDCEMRKLTDWEDTELTQPENQQLHMLPVMPSESCLETVVAASQIPMILFRMIW